MKKEETHIDSKGYKRFKDSKILVHRYIAEKYIWKKDRKKYPFPFEDYQVHHIDGNKEHNSSNNLKLVTLREHESEHKLIRTETLVIKFLFGILILMAVLNFVGLILSDYNININIKFAISVAIIILIFLIIVLVIKPKKGQRVI